MTSAHLERVRTAAAVAALVLAALSRGDALVLGALLVVVAWHLPALAVIPALLAASWRWGSMSLDALAGAQAVLGPAGFVDPTAAAAGSWLAAVAIVLSAPTEVGGMGVPDRAPGAPNLVIGALATGAAAAAVVAGPAPGGDVWIRAVAVVVAALAAVGVARLRRSNGRVRWTLDIVAVIAALGALAAVSRNAPGWAGTFDARALGQGVIVAVAAGALVTAGGLTRAAMGHREA